MTSTIKTVEDAFNYTGRDIAVLDVFKHLPEQDSAYAEACYKRAVVIEALNKEANGGENWTPDWNNTAQRKYFSWVWFKKNEAGNGFVVRGTDYHYDYTTTYVGSRLCFLNADLVLYFNSQFPELLQLTLVE